MRCEQCRRDWTWETFTKERGTPGKDFVELLLMFVVVGFVALMSWAGLPSLFAGKQLAWSVFSIALFLTFTGVFVAMVASFIKKQITKRTFYLFTTGPNQDDVHIHQRLDSTVVNGKLHYWLCDPNELRNLSPDEVEAQRIKTPIFQVATRGWFRRIHYAVISDHLEEAVTTWGAWKGWEFEIAPGDNMCITRQDERLIINVRSAVLIMTNFAWISELVSLIDEHRVVEGKSLALREETINLKRKLAREKDQRFRLEQWIYHLLGRAPKQTTETTDDDEDRCYQELLALQISPLAIVTWLQWEIKEIIAETLSSKSSTRSKVGQRAREALEALLAQTDEKLKELKNG